MSSPIQSETPSPRTTYRLDFTGDSAPVQTGHLKLGGKNSQGRTIELTSYYLLEDGKPVIPVMGEFHFSRYASPLWEEELLKMKAGGVTIVATYVFWNHIEEEEGRFQWSGNNDLRLFVQLCGKHQLDALVRIGPFAHGECRNGGLPDWLYGRPFRVRSNDEGYMRYVERLYRAIGGQLEGLLFKDGGPVIGIQLDNEYMHCGAPWEVTFRQGMEWVPAGFEGAEHIAQLRRLALAAGLDVPIYTCTGWLRSPIIEGEILPMQGGYAFTPWSPDPNFVQQPTREFLFRNRHLDPVLNGKAMYDAAKYPYVCCEIGGGIQITYYHRPIVPPEAVEGLAVMNLAGGANLIGYYMYHGGSNPVGQHSYMNEFTVPRISYDFQAPLREFGQAGASYGSLRMLHTFLADFGDVLAPMTPLLPDNASAIVPEDTASLRWMVRSKDGSGFIFLNNYQDHVEMQDIPNIRFQLGLRDETVSIPQNGSFTLQKDVTAILPFGLSLDGVRLKYATTQLFSKIEDKEATTYFFFAPRGMSSEYAFDKATYDALEVTCGEAVEAQNAAYVRVTPGKEGVITITKGRAKPIRVLTLTREQAEQSSKQKFWGRERLVISPATLVTDDGKCYAHAIGQDAISLSLYPPADGRLTAPSGVFSESGDGCFTRYSLSLPQKEPAIEVEMIAPDRALVRFPADIFNGLNNVFLRVDYVGDTGNAFVDGKLVHDHFYNGNVWEIGLRNLGENISGREMVIVIAPIRKGTGGIRHVPTGMAFGPDSEGESLASIRSIYTVPEYKVPIEAAGNS